MLKVGEEPGGHGFGYTFALAEKQFAANGIQLDDGYAYSASACRQAPRAWPQLTSDPG